jgi:hypothetical protein
MSAQAGTTYGTRFVFTATGQALYSGTGSPEGVVVASVGDLYFRQDGFTGSPPELLYAKATGTRTDTGWVVVI